MDLLQEIFKKDSDFVQVGDYKPMTYLRTGIITLDRMLGGGLPVGRVSEIFGAADAGKTTLCLTILKSAQEQGWLPAFVDLEMKLDPDNARKRVGLDDFAYIKPKSAEHAVELLQTFFNSRETHGKPCIAVVDSIAKLIPVAELQKDIDENQKIGYLAAFMAKLDALLVPLVNHTDNILIFTNQIRASMGPMGGCLPPKGPVWRSDLSSVHIQELSEKGNTREDIQVLSFDEDEGKIVTKPVIQVFNNGSVRDSSWVRIVTELFKSSTILTTCHIVPTDRGDIPAGEIKPGDKVITCFSSTFAEGHAKELLTGLVLAGTAAIELRTSSTARLAFKSYSAFDELTNWVTNALEKFELYDYYFGFRSGPRTDLSFLYRELYKPEVDGRFNKSIPEGFKLTPLQGYLLFLENFSKQAKSADSKGFFISLSNLLCNRYSVSEEAARMLLVVQEFVGTGSVIFVPKNRGLQLDEVAFEAFSSKITDWCSPVVRSYLHQNHRQMFEPKTLQIVEEIVPYWATVASVSEEHETYRRGGDRYDLEVADTHAYFAGNNYPILVHNSSTPGGFRARHMMSLRLKLEKKESIKGRDGSILGQKTFVSFQKNHISSTIRPGFELDVMREAGISRIGVLIDELEFTGYIKKSGAWYKWTEKAEEFGIDTSKSLQGRNGAIAYLEANPDLYDKLYDHLLNLAL